jgi:hypothetical protein
VTAENVAAATGVHSSSVKEILKEARVIKIEKN